MAAASQKDSPSVGSILHCSLLLLGYKASVYEADISASMFDKANTKGFESLLHFLFTKLRGASQSKKDFKDVWPVKDTQQQRHYRKVLHTLLSELQHEEKFPRRLVAALQSMFTTAAGARVTELLCHLSCYVLGQQMQEHYSQEARHSSYGHTKGDIGAIGADGASHDGCYGAEQAAVQTLHGKCCNILQHAGAVAISSGSFDGSV
ncbi:hypothetical protein WJX77_008750 [Trebouxia sp. C0004]